MIHAGFEELVRERALGLRGGRQGGAWVPGNLVTGGVTSTAKNGLPQRAVGVILLLKRGTRRSRQRVQVTSPFVVQQAQQPGIRG